MMVAIAEASPVQVRFHLAQKARRASWAALAVADVPLALTTDLGASKPFYGGKDHERVDKRRAVPSAPVSRPKVPVTKKWVRRSGYADIPRPDAVGQLELNARLEVHYRRIHLERVARGEGVPTIIEVKLFVMLQEWRVGKIVARPGEVSLLALDSNNLRREVSLMRHIAMHLCHGVFGHDAGDIAREFNQEKTNVYRNSARLKAHFMDGEVLMNGVVRGAGE